MASLLALSVLRAGLRSDFSRPRPKAQLLHAMDRLCILDGPALASPAAASAGSSAPLVPPPPHDFHRAAVEAAAVEMAVAATPRVSGGAASSGTQ